MSRKHFIAIGIFVAGSIFTLILNEFGGSILRGVFGGSPLIAHVEISRFSLPQILHSGYLKLDRREIENQVLEWTRNADIDVTEEERAAITASIIGLLEMESAHFRQTQEALAVC